MGDANSFTLPVAQWVGPREWAAVHPQRRESTLAFVAGRAQYLKHRELARGVGVDGKKLAPVKPSSRPDGATGRPLDPHYGDSRVVRLMRASVGKGHVTIWWGSGWGKILGYHRDGAGHLPVRDVIGLTPSDLRKLQLDTVIFWQSRGMLRPAAHVRWPGPTAPARPSTTQRPSRYVVVPLAGYTHLDRAVGGPAGVGPITDRTGLRQFRRTR